MSHREVYRIVCRPVRLTPNIGSSTIRSRRFRIASVSTCRMIESRYASRGSMIRMMPAALASSKSMLRISSSFTLLAVAWIASVTSWAASLPPAVNSLIPFQMAGLWLAVTIAP